MSVEKTPQLMENNLTADVAKKTIKHKDPKQPNPEITYDNYLKSTLALKTYKMPELKAAAKLFRLHISGSKAAIISRIETYFLHIRISTIIQRYWRGWLVRKSYKLRGPAVNSRTTCVNDTDFVTMEPLEEIPFENFYSYTDEKHFTYGFNVVSLYQLICKKTKNENPYNREKFSDKIIEDVISLYRSSYIIYPEFQKENAFVQPPPVADTPRVQLNRRYTARMMRNRRREMIQNQMDMDDDDMSEDESIRPENNVVIDYQPAIHAENTGRLANEDLERFASIQRIRSGSVTQRINQLFVEIDHLGNYTQSIWFSQLDMRGYYRLYGCLYDIWNYRGQMDNETKFRICPYHNPFDGIFSRPVQYGNLNLEQMQLVSLIVMENLIYSGVDEDYRKIGCFHALSGLTIVSSAARTAMPWLYESVMYQ
jgi:hypothetical protein